MMTGHEVHSQTFQPKNEQCSLLVHVLIFLLVSIPIITNTIWKKMSIYNLWVNFHLLFTEMVKCVKRV